MKCNRIAVLLLLLCSGCVSINTPPDVRLIATELVEFADQMELMCLDRTPDPGQPSVWPEGCKNVRKNVAVRPMLKVEFTTQTNLLRLSRDNSYPIGVYTKPCFRDIGESISIPLAYVQRQRVEDLARSYSTEAYRALPAPSSYYFFVDVAQTASSKDIPPRLALDLRTNAEDLCFELAGGSSGRGFRSNEVQISKAAIRAALAKGLPQKTESTKRSG